MTDLFTTYATPEQIAWIEALESGKYEQGQGRLCNSDGQHCCLGVACRVVLGDQTTTNKDGDLRWNGHLKTAPEAVVSSLHLRSILGEDIRGHSTLTFLNDIAKLPFPEIADRIRAEPWRWFTNFEEFIPNV